MQSVTVFQFRFETFFDSDTAQYGKRTFNLQHFFNRTCTSYGACYITNFRLKIIRTDVPDMFRMIFYNTKHNIKRDF